MDNKSKNPPKLLLFHIVCKGTPDIKIGEKLTLLDDIEDGDYFVLTDKNNITNRNNEMCRDLLDTLSFHESKVRFPNTLDNYRKEYLVITNARKIVKGFMRI